MTNRERINTQTRKAVPQSEKAQDHNPLDTVFFDGHERAPVQPHAPPTAWTQWLSVEQIRKIVEKHVIGLIILADSQMALRQYREFRDTDSFHPTRIVVAPDIFGSLSGLDGGSEETEANDNFNNFQCQHCLARYASHPFQIQNIRAEDFKATLLTK